MSDVRVLSDDEVPDFGPDFFEAASPPTDMPPTVCNHKCPCGKFFNHSVDVKQPCPRVCKTCAGGYK